MGARKCLLTTQSLCRTSHKNRWKRNLIPQAAMTDSTPPPQPQVRQQLTLRAQSDVSILFDLAPAMSEGPALRALALAVKITPPALRARVLSGLGPRLPQDQRDRVILQVWDAIGEVTSASPADLKDLAIAFAQVAIGEVTSASLA